MKTSSIVETIKRIVSSHTDASFSIREHTVLSELLSKEPKGEREAIGLHPLLTLRWDYRKGEKRAFLKACKHFLLDFCDYDTRHPFPHVHSFFVVCWKCLLCLVAGVYLIASGVYALFTWRWRNLIYSTRFNAFMFFASIITMLAMVVHLLVFFTRDVLFFTPRGSINDYGAVVLRQPYGKEDHLLLMNTAVYWTNTGIQLLEGDKVTISYSGNSYSDIGNMNRAAQANDTLRYRFDIPKVSGSTKSDIPDNDNLPAAKRFYSEELCVYHKQSAKDPSENARFGSILYAVFPDEKSIREYPTDSLNNKIFQANPKGEVTVFESVPEAGTLFVTSNDILLSERVTGLLTDRASSAYRRSAFSAMPSDTAHFLFCGERFPFEFADTFSREGRLRTLLQQNKQLWYCDNVGEYLLHITVERHNISFTEQVFRNLTHWFVAWKTVILSILVMLLLVAIDNLLFHKKQEA